VNPANSLPVTIRRAYPDDAPALRRLAALDNAPVPAKPMLVAEIDGELRVAVSIPDLDAIADPFVPTADIVEMLREHIKRTTREPAPRRRLRGKPVLAPRPRLV
jgi:hypothetical protein